jgi:hypothetical protein
MDLSRLSTEDLLALRSRDLSKISTAGLQYLKSQAPRRQAGVIESFKEAATTLKAAPAAARFAAAETPEEKAATRKALLAQAGGEEFDTTAFADIKDLPSALDWAKQVIGSSAGALAAPALAGVATGPVGGVAALGTQYTTSNLIRQAQEQERAIAEGRAAEETSVGKAIVGAGASTALDVAGFKFFQPLFKSFPIVGKLFGEGGEKGASEAGDRIRQAIENKSFTFKGGVARGVAKGVAFEIPQEIAQTAIERWQAGLSLTDPEARSEYLEAGAGAVLLGGGLGGASGFVSTRNEKRRAEEALREKRALEEKARKEAADKATEEAQKTAPEEVAKKIRETPEVNEDLLVNAERVIREVGDETKFSEHLNKLTETLNLPVKDARVVLKKLRDNKVISMKDGKFKVNAPEVDVLPYVAPTGEVGLEGVPATTAAVAQAQQTQAAQQAAAPTGQEAAAAAAAQPATVETTVPPPIETETAEGAPTGEPATGTTDVTAATTDTGAGAGSVDVSAPGSIPTGQRVEGTEPAGVGFATSSSKQLDAGETGLKPTLTLKQQKQQEAVESRDKRKMALDEITVKLNNFRTILPEQADEETVADLLRLTAKLEDAYAGRTESLKTLPKSKRNSEKEDKLDAKIVSLRNELNDLINLTNVQLQPPKTPEERQAELKGTEVEAQRRAAREDAGGLSAEEKTLPLTAQFEAALRKGVNNAIDFLGQSSAEAQQRLLKPRISETVRGAPEEVEVEGEDALVTEIAQRIRTRQPIEGMRRATKEETRKADVAAMEVLSGLTDTLSRVSFADSAVQIEGDNNADQNVFTRLRQQNKLAEYDPKTNTFYFTRDGLSRKILLHEATHAATVKVLRAFEVDPNTLTQSQREGAEQLVKIFTEAKKKLGGRYRNEFENVYEFASGVTTSNDLQRELSKIVRPNLAKYTKKLTNLWSQFTEALAKMFGIDSRKGTKPRLLDEDQAQISGLSRFIPGEAGYRGNFLLESSEALKYILTNPEKGVDVEPLPARRKGKRVTVPTREKTPQQTYDEATARDAQKYDTPSTVKKLTNFFSGQEGYEWLARKFQNDRRPLVWLQEQLRKAGLLVYGGEKANNLYDLIALSSGKAFHNMTQYMQRHFDDVHKSIKQYADAKGIDVNAALGRLSMYLTALHEKERRHMKYLMNVPLDNTNKIPKPELGVQGTPAMLREYMMRELHKSNDLVSNGKAKQYRQILEDLVANHKDVNGFSPTKAKPGTMSLDENSADYKVIGTMDPKLRDEIVRDFEADQNTEATAASVNQLLKSMEEIKANTKMLDKEAKYWSQPVDNIVEFYGYENYVPFKGKPDANESDENLEIGGRRLGGEYAEAAQAAEGRESDSDNVILQLLADGTKSTMRAGRSGVTQAIKNLIKDGYIRGSKKPKVVKFEDRYKGFDPAEIRGENKIFHYTGDGTIEVYTINDKVMRDAIRRVYQTQSPFIEFANKITSGIGHFHTRYNPAFYPYNFVRDALTNAFTMGADMSPKAAFDYLGAVAVQISKVGMVKSGRIAKMYAEGKVSEIEALAKKDPDVANILEYLEEGGRTTYIQGLSLQSQKEELAKSIGKQKYARTSDQINKWVDIWADSFEFTSRAAAYAVAKSNAMARGATEAQARQEAAAYAKNLANFEQVGEYGRQAGALFMFFRPAATGAVRAFDSIAPLLQNLESAEARLPPGIRDNPEAMAKFRENFVAQQDKAKSMIYGLLGAGATLYLMAYMASDDDELGRNKVETDDMALWTRNLRLPLNIIGSEGFLQLPWGFGLGAFGAAGAQVAGVAFGKTSVKDMAVNMTNVALDSFMPLPVSRIDPTENFPAWIVDSIVPSAARPFVEFAMNVDGLGREIYNNRATKYGEAYTGGRNVPELYKTMAQGMFEFTNGDIKVQPNTLYFWTNNYIDGISRIAHSAYGIGLTAAGQKDFDPKTDLVVFSSFVGRKGNYDAREFASVEKKIKDKADTLRSLENTAKLNGDVEPLRRYFERNPNDRAIVYIYNKQINNRLRDLRSFRNAVQSNKNYTPKQKKEMIDQIDLEQNYIKRGMIEMFRQYGVNP